MKRLPLVGALCLAASLAVAGPPNKADDAKKRMTKGVEQYNSKRYEEAIKSFSDALQLAPDAAGPHRELAKCYQQLGQPEKTIHHFTVYLERRPDAPERSDIEAFLPELRAALPKTDKGLLSVEASAGALLFWSVNGEERGLGTAPLSAYPVPPGEGTLRLLPPTGAPQSLSARLNANAKITILQNGGVLALKEAPKAAPKPKNETALTPKNSEGQPGDESPRKDRSTGAIALFVVGGASAVPAALFGVSYLRESQNVFSVDPTSPDGEALNKRLNALAIGFWSSSLVAIGTTNAAFWVRSNHRASQAPRAALQVLPGGLALSGAW
jgi:tetratricopeptide (TPR) repeat protein